MLVLCDMFVRGGGKSGLPQAGTHSDSRWTLPIAVKLQEPPFKGRPKRNLMRRWADLASPQASRQRGHPPHARGGLPRRAAMSVVRTIPRAKPKATFGGTAPKNKCPTTPVVPKQCPTSRVVPNRLSAGSKPWPAALAHREPARSSWRRSRSPRRPSGPALDRLLAPARSDDRPALSDCLRQRPRRVPTKS